MFLFISIVLYLDLIVSEFSTFNLYNVKSMKVWTTKRVGEGVEKGWIATDFSRYKEDLNIQTQYTCSTN